MKSVFHKAGVGQLASVQESGSSDEIIVFRDPSSVYGYKAGSAEKKEGGTGGIVSRPINFRSGLDKGGIIESATGACVSVLTEAFFFFTSSTG